MAIASLLCPFTPAKLSSLPLLRPGYAPENVSESLSTTPQAIRQKSVDLLAILWADGHESTYDVHSLRLACACAQCIDEWTGEARLAVERVPEDVHPLRIRPVGRYAIQIDWSDGHNTGIYPFQRLRNMGS